MENEEEQLEEEMSNTFIGEVNQKSAIAKDDVEELDTSMNEKPMFPDVPIEPPKETISMPNTKDVNDYIAKANQNVDNNKPMPEIESDHSFEEDIKSKKGHPILIVFLMLLCLAIGTGGTYYYFEILNKETTKPESKETSSDLKAKEELNPESNFIKIMIEKYDYNSIEGVYKYLYSQEKTTIESMDETYLRFLVAQEANKSLSGAYFTSEQFKKAKSLLFGEKMILEDKSIAAKSCVHIEYDSNSKVYNYIEPNGCGGMTDRKLIRKIVKGTKISSNLEITVAVGIAAADGKIYRSEDKDNNLTNEVIIDNGQTFNIDNDYTKLNQYKYIFNYDKLENNYTLNSIELVK